MLNGKTILITGGTGSFGHAFVKRIYKDFVPKKVIVFSRDEFKQSQMAQEIQEETIRFFIGDVRDGKRLYRAFGHVDYVVHAAALKQVPALEYNPTEAVRTNVDGAINVVEAALERRVKKVINLSSDKAVNPINLYGATKMTAEKIFTAANAYAGYKTKFSSVRYGNVIGSRGSVIPLFQKLREENKPFTVTDKRMTRFWLTLDEAVNIVLFALGTAMGGEIYVPRMPSMKIVDVAKTIDRDRDIIETGVRPGEKIHEILIAKDETNVVRVDGDQIEKVDEFRSDTNDLWMNHEQLAEILEAKRRLVVYAGTGWIHSFQESQ